MWTDIPVATTIPYSFTGISSSTYYRLVVTCAASSTEDFSPGVLITFVACTCPGMTAGTAFASVTSGCSTTPITMSAAAYTVGGVTYRWQASPDRHSRRHCYTLLIYGHQLIYLPAARGNVYCIRR